MSYSSEINNECQESLPQSYYSLNNMGKLSIITPPLENKSYSTQNMNKIARDEHYEKHKHLEESRKQQDQEIKQSIDNFCSQYKKN